jgi:hypothetical protein
MRLIKLQRLGNGVTEIHVNVDDLFIRCLAALTAFHGQNPSNTIESYRRAVLNEFGPREK